ncbi:Biotin--protein ligase [Alkalibacterium sp. AK22]|uniref:biotin--[acetyl-CoA-carboxylase] ligase n=1 Tax=Alkalibacterium sp. AK22 TaxID=1229520 RepID=UPI00044F21BF|nr:biotin--[acetyl-CoA-carboxylase] ligase [Alkalibacterium sp. AK22]EXJ24254.1 Biotin--protein ligase [Alkalibacterium sp. AK22]
MKTTLAVLNALKLSYPHALPIQLLAQQTGLSSSVVTQQLHELITEGYPLAINSHNCCLTLPLIEEFSLKAHLNTEQIGRSLHIFDRTASTNAQVLSDLSIYEHGDVVLTDYQYKGRGRLGRNWQAAPGKSIAFSIVLKPDIHQVQPVLLTQLAAAALSVGLDKLTGSQIKWPNDLVIGSKKVAGILTESQFTGGKLEGLVVGIGINTNLSPTDFSEELSSKATSLFIERDKPVDPNPLIAAVLNQFDRFYTDWIRTQDASSFIRLCQERSALLNRRLTVHSNGLERAATVTGIGSGGELLVKYADGETDSLTSLNFSVRAKNSYL